MFGPYRSYLAPTAMAVGLHLVIGYLVVGSWFEGDTQHRVQPFRHVKAELVDLSSQTRAVEEAAEARQKAEQKKKAAERKRAQEAKRKKEKAAADKKRKADAERKKRQAAERKKKAAADKKRKADAARKREADAKAKAKAKAKKEAELKARQQAKREAEAKAERERQAQARRQQEAERMEREAAAEMERIEAAQQEAEQAAARRAQEKDLVASAVSVIRDGVQRNWRRPPSARNGMRVGVRIHLLPTGEVDDAYVVKSSGDDAFDRSAVNAVLKAERFPELQGLDPVVFDRNLRQINLEFRPEDLRL